MVNHNAKFDPEGRVINPLPGGNLLTMVNEGYGEGDIHNEKETK